MRIMENEERVLAAVRQIVGQCRKEGRVPEVATLREVKKACPEIPSGVVLPAVRQLERAGLVQTGRTVNDIYIRPVPEKAQ